MIFVWIVLLLFFLDLLIKKHVDKNLEIGEEKSILKNRIIVRKVYNKGAIFSTFSDSTKMVVKISQCIMIVLGVLWAVVLRNKESKGLKLGLSLMLAGGMNNLWDRMTKGHVVDYFSFQSAFPKIKRIVFNISDMFIFIGGFLMMICYGNKNK